MNKMKELQKQETVKKTRAVNQEIIVRMIDDQPYYSIRYFDLDDCRLHVGYSSYKLEFVVEWLRECFDIVNTKSGWIPVSECLPKDLDNRFYMCIVGNHEEDLTMFCQYDEELGFGFWTDIYDEFSLGFVDTEFKTNEEFGYEKVIAWRQLPEPYMESQEIKKQTNADKIRNMTDEEMADFLMDISIGMLFDKKIMNVKYWLQSESEE